MTNDEKILEILLQMQSDISALKSGQMKLEQDVADVKADVIDLKSGQTKLEQDVADVKADVIDLKSGQTKLEQDVADVKADVIDLKSGQTKLEQNVTDLKFDVTDLKSDVSTLKFDVTKLKSGQEQLVRNQEFLSQHIVALENELIPKVTALFDGYTLRGEQIDNLKAHFDARLDDYQEDVSYLISKTGKQEKQILSMSRQVKHILP